MNENEEYQLVGEFRVIGTPVSVNKMYMRSWRGGQYLSIRAEAWMSLVWAEAHNWRMKHRTLRAPLKVDCIFYGTTADTDNLLKLTIDGVKHGILLDDKHFDVSATRGTDGAMKRGAIIRISSLAFDITEAGIDRGIAKGLARIWPKDGAA